jgi:hypothetical protein
MSKDQASVSAETSSGGSCVCNLLIVSSSDIGFASVRIRSLRITVMGKENQGDKRGVVYGRCASSRKSSSPIGLLRPQ